MGNSKQVNRRQLFSPTEVQTFVLVLAIGSFFAVFLCCLAVTAFQDPNSRPRRSAVANPTPATTPINITRPSPSPTATPTPTRAPKPTPSGQGLPTLGEPPPPPVFRPKPSPTPEGGEEVDPESVVRVNTALVTLNVRVIDRNNRPIDNLRQ